MRRAAALVLLTCALMLGGCANEQHPEQTELTPPFWVAEDAQTGGTLYMLGSMHVGQKDTYYPDYVLEAYESSTIVAAEVDTEAERSVILEGIQHLMCPEDTDAASFFGDDYAAVADFFESEGLYTRQLDAYIPYFWCSYLSTAAAEDCGLYSDHGSESFFISRAHADGKSFAEIESYEEQYRMMSEIPMSVQVYSVTSAIGEEQFAKQLDNTLALYEAWAGFDTAALEELNTTLYEDIPTELSADYAVFVDKMYIERQQRMADAAVELLQSGETAFMLVGAAHFYIEEDILTLLEAEGYTVTEIRPDAVSQAA